MGGQVIFHVVSRGGGGVFGYKFCLEGGGVIQNLDDGSKF